MVVIKIDIMHSQEMFLFVQYVYCVFFQVGKYIEIKIRNKKVCQCEKKREKKQKGKNKTKKESQKTTKYKTNKKLTANVQ